MEADKRPTQNNSEVSSERVRNLDDVEVNCDEKLALSSQPGGKL
jgi:hypothetical protein